MANRFRRFPEGFLWGASVSAHQVEGNNHNDWTRWEKANADRLAAQARRRLSGLPLWKEIAGEASQRSNYISGQAADFYERYDDDFAIAENLGLSAFRLSIEWSRIQPTPDKFNKKAIIHYRRMIKALRQRGMEPFVTLWHWPLPLWLADQGGWTNPEISHHFIGYVAFVVRELGDDVKFWITLNEPNVYTEQSYLLGHWPPARRSLRQYFMTQSNLVRAHREAYHIVKSIDPKAQIGLSNNFIPYSAYHGRWLNRLLQAYADLRWNYLLLLRVKNHLDFIGVNQYLSYRINFGFNIGRPGIPKSDLGWQLYPPAMYSALRDLGRYKLPIYVTESGLADRHDRYRSWFIGATLKQIHRAIEHGVDVRGYFHWSLLDNFEWSEGYWPRFGLVEVDFKTQARKVRDSAWDYAGIIKQNGVRDLTD